MNGHPMTNLQQAAGWMAGARISGDAARTFSRVHTDSRTVQPGDLFVALKGDRFDAHDFLADVVARGAAAVLVSRDIDLDVPALIVPDTRIGLGEIGAGWRRQFAPPTVAVTGSNGKTTVKEMIAAIFAAAVGEDDRLATGGNLNNDIGLPLTVLRLRAHHKLAVLELGMNHPGETVYLAGIAQPTVAVITNAQREHQEFMVSVEAVAHEHASAIAALPADGVAVFPVDAESGGAHAAIWRQAAGTRRVLAFGTDASADVRATVSLDDGVQVLHVTAPGQTFDLRLQLLGAHNVRNALAATACALAAGVAVEAIQRGIAGFSAVKGRLQVKHTPAGTVVIDDTYNANPDSMRAAIDVLAGFAAPRVLVLGDMGEVGDQGPAFHTEIGAYARERGIDTLWALGDLATHAAQAYGAGARHFAGAEDLVRALGEDKQGVVAGAAAVLVKGSRFMRMERMVEALVASPSAH
ncbi:MULTISPECIES: UDP-N-acetylmuramoyl-tripeptide--D-alanyl-D-alanine ligase [unclassified Cupriavidus]|uniref:UDP-N-acetylmuramoyl-tripeptide--D-alanyl-D- alanine ligase n=1 Tax=unclassified Cupriavidus TaxID=2640874 RepID=UPI001C004351|nr:MULTISPECIES: UDP-N-acetylmuramoyl-tripeptide--D-alanyl-D-alanine ligase [unclassified Cupriavidus]MCA3185430.1 UDP-N-acetylmuramoyl-tripeptide--D-alanyl-D-alanine ligase [Cupriavidus sp.]MCA3189989.1 UDP-N-acetylmuramoyl-tripeptide--D-alanyl-D-alanine ligase [Cupriavidus sp.]MCA3196888.1 UDP-N-acetylmuramoyl-tripeptide--D-alanyl-D-alanine ligase [Cupriavidus sp.]MCA3204387.1 UDP-N-acetylmuramoyl-tripeptide--D-alanyl-D-alanine ligase [Cupriavidus sp.]MCA3207954.1 UDP-N-acetylmuramoyl-tripep